MNSNDFNKALRIIYDFKTEQEMWDDDGYMSLRENYFSDNVNSDDFELLVELGLKFLNHQEKRAGLLLDNHITKKDRVVEDELLVETQYNDFQEEMTRIVTEDVVKIDEVPQPLEDIYDKKKEYGE